ncbi:MAG: helix-turn-helix transcriptional regulator [Rhodospirillum sp.]|nr:helix-turn-helix transcriptional regulator [Rhodospirillum sp.]MCF8490938.1 helix-turn-helix transcriptional regulator [Rhodospirillum sp.]MCF8502636.1 helix-turn-helix transcriptional regulator [Rhodospirillum sp.]
MARISRSLQYWNARLATVVEAIGTPPFMEALCLLLNDLVPFDMTMIFGYRGRAKPLSLYHDVGPSISGIIVDNYLKGPYLLDPFFEATQNPHPASFLVMQDLAPDQFKKSAYFRQHYASTRIQDEVGFVFPAAGGVTAVLSLTRSVGNPRFRRGEIQTLADVAPLTRALSTQHWMRQSTDTEKAPVQTSIAESLSGFGPLTPREAEITGLVLKGHSTLSIAANLAISHGTVKVHRKNIYRKLNISSQGELFSLFLLGVKDQFP